MGFRCIAQMSKNARCLQHAIYPFGAGVETRICVSHRVGGTRFRHVRLGVTWLKPYTLSEMLTTNTHNQTLTFPNKSSLSQKRRSDQQSFGKFVVVCRIDRNRSLLIAIQLFSAAYPPAFLPLNLPASQAGANVLRVLCTPFQRLKAHCERIKRRI